MNLAPRIREGVALLEALVALVVLGTVASALLASTGTAYRAVVVAREAETQVREAQRLLDATTLWSRGELDQRLGERAQGPMTMRIDRLTRTLYLVSLRDTATGAELLRTALYREEVPDAAR
jgi:type II secretory pathway pseudopilin PulG